MSSNLVLYNTCQNLVYCSICCEPMRNFGHVHEHAQIVFDDYDRDYDVLLRKSGKVTMEIKQLRVLATEIFKTVSNLNPNYMKDIFTPKLHSKV